MGTYLFPDEYLPSAYRIDYRRFYDEGIRGIIFDIDNTLVPHGAPADDRARELFEELRKTGFQVVLLSNNKEPRVKLFRDGLLDASHVQYIFKAGKPGGRGYRRAMELMGTETRTTLFVGDQIFTDVWGAKRAGIYAVLTKKIHPKEEIQIVLKRVLEWFILLFYRLDCKAKGRSMEIHLL